MSMDPKNEPTDEQLDELLRDVQVPLDLKARLREIPGQEFADKTPDSIAITPSTTKQSPAHPTSWLSVVVLAGVLGIAAIIAFQWLINNAGEPRQNGSVATIDSQGELESHESESQLIKRGRLEQLQRKQQLLILEDQLAQLEIAQLERKLSQVEQANKQNLDPTEVEAMIAALAPEFSIELGGSESDVRLEMAQVIKKYPGTQGALRAEQFLKQIN